MRGDELFNAGVAFCDRRYADESDSVKGKVINSFVEGGIWVTVRQWVPVVGKNAAEVEAVLDGHFPVLLYHESERTSAVADNHDALASLEREGRLPFTHAMPLEYPV